MCLARRYRSVTCRHQWVRLARSCGRDARGNPRGFDTCRRWREGHAAADARYAFATRVRHGCPLCDLDGDYDPATVLMIRQVQRGFSRRPSLTTTLDRNFGQEAGSADPPSTATAERSHAHPIPIYVLPPPMFDLPLRPRASPPLPPPPRPDSILQPAQLHATSNYTPLVNGIRSAEPSMVVPVRRTSSRVPQIHWVPSTDSIASAPAALPATTSAPAPARGRGRTPTPGPRRDAESAVTARDELTDGLVRELRDVLQDILANAMHSLIMELRAAENLNSDHHTEE